MVTLAEIRDDIVDDSVSLSSVLRKAKILAYNLDNNDFKNWVNSELEGYKGEVELPDYRKLPSLPQADIQVDGKGVINGSPINLMEFADVEHEFLWPFGASYSEQYCSEHADGSLLYCYSPPEITNLIKKLFHHQYPNAHIIQFYHVLSVGSVIGILSAIRDRLLNFILELQDIYPDESLPQPKNPAEAEKISDLVQSHIIIHHNGGELNMSTFDQRHQSVKGNQYNAGRDINFAGIQSKDDFIDTLKQLRAQIEETPTEDETDSEAAADIKHQLEKAAIESAKAEPNKGKIRSYIEKATSLAKDTVTFAGMIVAFQKLIEIADKFI